MFRKVGRLDPGDKRGVSGDRSGGMELPLYPIWKAIVLMGRERKRKLIGTGIRWSHFHQGEFDDGMKYRTCARNLLTQSIDLVAFLEVWTIMMSLYSK